MSPIALQSPVLLNSDQAHYLIHVMRLKEGNQILLFNGKHGEWLSTVTHASKKAVAGLPIQCVRPQQKEPGPALYFAPIKKDPLSFLIQKATELGVSSLHPVLTERTVHPHINLDRLTAIAIEAAEQSRRLTVPLITKPISLKDVPKPFYFLDESGSSPMISSFSDLRTAAFILGPEGGFSEKEFSFLRDNGIGVSLGPLILRAETAALAVLAYGLLQ